MSVTFSAMGAPREQVDETCYSCDGQGREAYHGTTYTCDCCGGRGALFYEASPHELNVSNGNAAALCAAAGLTMDEYGCGTLPVEELPAVRSRVVNALNDARDRATHAVAPSEGRGAAGCHWIDGGVSDDYLQRRLAALLRLVEYAHANGYALTWG